MQVISHRFGIALALVSSIVLAGCSDREVILPGKREPILKSEPSATEGAGALSAPKAFAMPRQKNNVAWPQGHASPSTQVVHAALSAAPKPLWTLSVGTGDRARNRITADPIVAEGIVFTLDSLSVLTATSTAGSRLWSRDLTPSVERAGDADGGGIAYGDGVVFVSTGYGVLHALDPKSGSALWKQELKGSGNGRPSYFDGVVYLVSQDSVAWAIEAATGRIRWQLDHLSDVNNMSGSTGPAISEKLAVFGFGAGDLQAAFRGGGLTLWNATLAGGRSGRAVATIDDIATSPVISGSTVFAANSSGRIAAMHLDSGARLWTAPYGARSPLWPAGGSLFFVNDLGQLMRLDATDGSKVWSVDLPGFVSLRQGKSKDVVPHHGPVLAGGRLLLASGDGLLRQFDPETGAERSAIRLGSGATANPIVADGILYVLCRDGKLRAYR
ncbi:MAG: PQQ-binding-like beta-propeller repeat protein [Rhodobacteraceae bacterium]|nr:PQQ-binding-like beta-propeller repeat protein [Paracoccaceae bacterium]MBL6639043.1 PQQ-binding-like beta-propeller repeat protein [Paracoccaceae bacterium]MBL6675795.1 PQQ-binding-like beta-propeller repeat protein [Paracoccaceae bacterium]MBL6788151.1 PQQ-binding-like beta-propeller repeat protein [Paracoccaceae bacterium]MBL6858488.1 PQQ-binding-like beta-propeller repeat protein [Paracoccaceae bacterium]